jgi:hypothetical protein
VRTLQLHHPKIAALHLAGEAVDQTDDNVDLLLELVDGRRFSFTAFTPQNLARLIQDRQSFVSPGLLVVRQLSDEALVDAITDAVEQGVEQFGVLQR